MRDKLGRFVKGHHSSPLTEFKKGERCKEKHPQWKGGKHYCNGYIAVLAPEHPNSNKRGRIYEHRLVIEDKIGRYLTKNESVHHINGIKTDNRLENLVVCKSQKEHYSHHDLERKVNKNKIFDLFEKNKSIHYIAKYFGVHIKTVYEYKKKWKQCQKIY
jgi:hypothetical protein